MFYFRPVPPMVMWAQRPNLIFLTVCVEDCGKPEIKVEGDKLFFKGVGGPEKKEFEVTINFFKEVDTEVKTTMNQKEVKLEQNCTKTGPRISQN